jgi:hypothetical protein
MVEDARAYRVCCAAPSVSAVVHQWRRPPLSLAEPDASAPQKRRLSVSEMHFLWSVAQAKVEDEERAAARVSAAEEARVQAEAEERAIAIEQVRGLP